MSTLNIYPVLEEDTQRTFLCTLASPQQQMGQTKIPVKISKLEEPTLTWLAIGFIIGGCTALFIIIIIIIFCVKRLCGPRVRLMINKILPRFGPKFIEDENIKWNVYIHHVSEDEYTATEWKNALEHLGYKCRITADMKYGQSEMNDFKEAVSHSALILFLYSKNLLKEQFSSFYLDTVICERNGNNIMILEKTDFNPKEIKEMAKETKKHQGEAVGGASIEVSLEDSNDAVETDGDAVTAEEVDFLESWKTIPRLKVPDKEASGRIKKNFLCSLQNCIPRFKKANDNPGKLKISKDRSGSGKPLLESPPVSPDSLAGHANPSLEMSPSQEADIPTAFDYDETSVMKVVEIVAFQTGNGHKDRQNAEDDVIGNPHGELYLAQVPRNKKELNINVDVHDIDYRNAPMYQYDQNNVLPELSNAGNAEQNHCKEAMFSMSDEGGPSSISPNSESAYASCFENSEERINSGSESQAPFPKASSVHSSSGFGSQSSPDSSSTSPPISDQSYSPQRYGSHSNDSPVQTFEGHSIEGPVTQLQGRGDQQTRGAQGRDVKNLKVMIDQTGLAVGNSPESGYVTCSTERFTSAGAFLPQIKEAVG